MNQNDIRIMLDEMGYIDEKINPELKLVEELTG
jgi:hypothetical protein